MDRMDVDVGSLRSYLQARFIHQVTSSLIGANYRQQLVNALDLFSGFCSLYLVSR